MPSKRKKTATPPRVEVDNVAGLPEDIAAIRAEISKFFAVLDEKGRKVGGSVHGVYAFYDYDREPIYVGQTYEGLRARIGRHLTNQRTDAVAMNVLDPFEVAEIEIWPLDDEMVKIPEVERLEYLNRAEFTVFEKVLGESALSAVLNEKSIAPRAQIKLPKSYRQRIIPDEIYRQRKHPDVRIARRASTIAALARVISERDVSKGLRRTLLTQARRLERLAAHRVQELGITEDYKKNQQDD
ncbi:MAG: GIY-YIG nuclease family protein [Opitutaceae bacterium]|jgi:hypothetical protein